MKALAPLEGARGHRGKARRRIALALVSALLLGCVALHGGLEQHDALHGPTQVFRTCAAPPSTSHFDTACALELPACPACLLQVQTVGAAMPLPQRFDRLVAFGRATIPQPAPARLAAERLPSSRGPPRA